MRERHWSIFSRAPRRRSDRRAGEGSQLGSRAAQKISTDSKHHEDRRRAAIPIVRDGLARAEEKYLVSPDATLGTWHARVAETVAVASRVALKRLDEGYRSADVGVAEEQIGLFADICAEAIRAASQVWGKTPALRAREEIIELITAAPGAAAGPSWFGTFGSIAHCIAAMEPLANGLRDGDLPMGDPTNCGQVAESLVEVAIHSLQAIDALC